ncbi:TolC family protein [Anaeromyxobacter paludicola]|uniref:Outer membrane efflux protein n=1 Tax=Anaeromyxobacter paludicola TaxID=2918171 RepID=A0ABM7XB83_9BACT|nr:TolC family protein [Anaeromyxobacter paludicola]BDG09120.1 hypothetical protein AMPC_22330 [Anaeromyxobacter paludicola]
MSPRRAALLAAALLAAGLPGAPRAAAPEPPLLGLDEAVAAALARNHLLAGAALEVEKQEDRADALRTRRLPALRLDLLASRLLEPLDFTFPAGTFGTFPGVGPFPPLESRVRTEPQLTTVALVTASQPLTQQYRIGLGLRALELGRDLAREQLRGERQRIRAEVRATYYRLSATQAAVAALSDLVRALEELDQQTGRYLAEEVVLRGDALEVKARLARERWRLSSAESGLATQRERLDQLLGRDLGARFRVEDPSALRSPAAELGLEEARARARARRPELRRAALQRAQAETGLRLSRADWIPDVTLSAHYARLVDFHFLPDHVADVGLLLSWEPFDWGRRGKEASAAGRAEAQAEAALAEAESQVGLEVGARWRALRDATGLLEATRLSVAAARESLATTMNRYREDAKVLRDVLEAEARLSGARHDEVDAIAGRWAAAADLERALGDDD